MNVIGCEASVSPTSSFHHGVQHHLARYSPTEQFRHIGTDGSYETSKPAPDLYLLTSERLTLASKHCLALKRGQKGARSAAAGMMAIMIPDISPLPSASTSASIAPM
ncbi:hypothetical protein [Bosea sp. UC22_33]|uniref:hypothetical protein n=1 Tax=Bosea sp. UC22_33 TaxID=3350165 RepID=UPI0036728F5B